MRACVIGLGKIGLPLAAQYASKGVEVIGCDVSQRVVDSINSGVSHVKEEPGLDEKVRDAVSKNLLSATTDTVAAVRKSDVIVIIVPLVVDPEGNTDYSIVDSVTEKVAEGLQKDSLVIYETTLPVGDTRNRMAPILERSGLKAGSDFYLVFSPERVSSGIMFQYLRDIPKIVGGINEESTKRGVSFYEKALDAKIIPVSSSEAAEATKLFGMVYRDINISIANEFAKYCNAAGLDVKEIISASNTNPHSHILLPGVGVGGHCAPVYPYFLIRKASEAGVELSHARQARKINDSMPDFTAGLLKEELGALVGRKILVLGLAYRNNVKEIFKAPAVPLIERLKAEGAEVYLNDTVFSDDEIRAFDAEPVGLDFPGSFDAAILVTNHAEYNGLDFKKLRDAGVRVFIDGRNIVDPEKVTALGITYVGVGRSKRSGEHPTQV